MDPGSSDFKLNPDELTQEQSHSCVLAGQCAAAAQLLSTGSCSQIIELLSAFFQVSPLLTPSAHLFSTALHTHTVFALLHSPISLTVSLVQHVLCFQTTYLVPVSFAAAVPEAVFA